MPGLAAAAFVGAERPNGNGEREHPLYRHTKGEVNKRCLAIRLTHTTWFGNGLKKPMNVCSASSSTPMDSCWTRYLGGLNIHLPAGTGFKVTVSFDKPAGLPAAATDVVDITSCSVTAAHWAHCGLSPASTSTPARPISNSAINLEQKLWLTEISVVGFPIPGLNNLFANSLRNLKLIPLVPFPVDHTTTNNLLFKNADVRIIDDTSPADQDASAFLLTFGGGSPGESRRSRRVSSRRVPTPQSWHRWRGSAG